MVDSINNPAANALTRVRQTALTTGVQGNARAVQTIINQTQKPAVLKVRTVAVTQANKSNKPAPLPRGSLIDVLA